MPDFLQVSGPVSIPAIITPGFEQSCAGEHLPIDDLLTDVSRHCVDQQNQEDGQNSDNEQHNDVLLVPLPDKEHKGLHGIHKPVERRFWPAGTGRDERVSSTLGFCSGALPPNSSCLWTVPTLGTALVQCLGKRWRRQDLSFGKAPSRAVLHPRANGRVHVAKAEPPFWYKQCRHGRAFPGTSRRAALAPTLQPQVLLDPPEPWEALADPALRVSLIAPSSPTSRCSTSPRKQVLKTRHCPPCHQ